jgi:hypothetical protein
LAAKAAPALLTSPFRPFGPSGELGVELAHTLLPSGESCMPKALRGRRRAGGQYALIAAGFDQWADPDDLAVTLLATLEGALVLAQVHRDTRAIETAVNTLLALAIGR